MGHGMSEALAHCEKFLREEDKDRYLASLFAPWSPVEAASPQA